MSLSRELAPIDTNGKIFSFPTCWGKGGMGEINTTDTPTLFLPLKG